MLSKLLAQPIIQSPFTMHTHGEQMFSVYYNGQRTSWLVGRLWRLSANLDVTYVEIAQFKEHLDEVADAWLQEHPESQFDHRMRVKQAELHYPIIISAEGDVMDGRHRLMRAKEMGWFSIPARIFAVTPDPDDSAYDPWSDMSKDPQPWHPSLE